jgi:biopolymer transport protein ExbD
MKFRTRAAPHVMGFQIAPMVDIFLVLLCFFIMTWSFAKKEMDLSVKVPSAENGKESSSVLNQTVLNVRTDGLVVWNNTQVSHQDLEKRLKTLAKDFPDFAVIVRADENVEWKFVSNVIDTCRAANIWNVAFATRKRQ